MHVRAYTIFFHWNSIKTFKHIFNSVLNLTIEMVDGISSLAQIFGNIQNRSVFDNYYFIFWIVKYFKFLN